MNVATKLRWEEARWGQAGHAGHPLLSQGPLGEASALPDVLPSTQLIPSPSPQHSRVPWSANRRLFEVKQLRVAASDFNTRFESGSCRAWRCAWGLEQR